MDDATQTGFYMTRTPTLSERFWRRAGFRYHLGDEPEGTDGMPGWMCHGVRMKFGIVDRLRLLLTGRLHVKSVMHTDVPSANVVKTRIDWEIIRPGGDW